MTAGRFRTLFGKNVIEVPHDDNPSHLDRHYDLATQQSQKSSEVAPEFPWSHYDLGEIYEWTGRHREAIEEYTKAQEIFRPEPEETRRTANGVSAVRLEGILAEDVGVLSGGLKAAA
jgi:hypothetical protein